nr:MAG TPA: hypothetical protein [Bacteriophage sp.]
MIGGTGYDTRTVSWTDAAKSYRINRNGQKYIERKAAAANFAPAFILPFDVKLNDDHYIIT